MRSASARQQSRVPESAAQRMWQRTSASPWSSESLPITRGAGLQQVGHDMQDQRYSQQDQGNSGGAVIIVFLQPDEGEQRGDLGLEGQVAGDEDDGTELAKTTGEGHGAAGQPSRQDRREHHPRKDRP